MAFIQYLKFNGEALPLPDSYDMELFAVEADTTGETEAGTIQRDVVRQGVVNITVSFSVSAVWLKKLTAYSKKDKLAVEYFDTEELELKQTEMYMVRYIRLCRGTIGAGTAAAPATTPISGWRCASLLVSGTPPAVILPVQIRRLQGL